MSKLNFIKARHNKMLFGIILMVLHALVMSVHYIFAKKLTQSLHPFQVAFLYKFAILACVFPWCFYGGLKKNLTTQYMGMHIARGTFSLMGTLCFFVAVSGISVGNATAITYLDNILIVLIGVFYFKEKLTHSKIVLICVSCLGAMLIVKPGFVTFNKYYIYLFLALIFWAMNTMVIKILGATERTKAQFFYVTFFSSVFSLPLALYEWREIEPWHLKYILASAFCYLIHIVAFFKAFKFAEMSIIMPFDYSRLIFTGLLGYFLLNEIPDNYSLAGYTLITLSGIYALHFEAKKKRKISAVKKAELESEYEHI